MTLLTVLLAMTAHGNGALQDPKAFNFGGEPVSLSMPAASQDATPSADLASWPGWSSLGGVFDTPFMGAGDWSVVQSSYLASNPKEATPWRTKIVLLASVDTLCTLRNGVLEDHRNTITGDRFTGTLNAIAQFIALVSYATGGKVRIVPDVLIDPEPSRDTASPGKPAFDATYLNGYLEGRINGGQYESDDRIFRGPYNSVLFIDPCAHGSPMLENPQSRFLRDTFRIDATPTSRISFDPDGAGASPGAEAISLFDAWTATVSDRAVGRGLAAISGSLDGLDWKSISDSNEPATDVLLARLATHPSAKASLVPLSLSLFQPSFKTANIKLAIVKDASKGGVLEYTESHLTRFGGTVLPHGPGPIDSSKTPTLTVTYKTSSDQPLSLAFLDVKGKTHWVSLGHDPELADPSLPKAESLPVQHDGAWHSISIDLRSFGPDPIQEIRLGASPSAAVLTTDLATPVTYEFAEFRLGSDTPTPAIAEAAADAASPDPYSRSLAAIEAGKKGQPSPELASLLKDANETVVLNALAAYSNIVDPFAEPKLIELAGSPTPRIAEFALQALNHQNTTAANAEIEQALKSGFEYSREIAAKIIASRHDAKSAEQLVVLLAGRLWHTRLASVEALAEVPGIPSQIMRRAILQQDDPVIKLAVVEHTDPQNDDDMRKLLWTSVNEPSDQVRAESDEKLIQSKLSDMSTQGLKGVRDDSWWTRVLVLKYLKVHPSEAARGAIKLALGDPMPRVRAAAIEALGGLQSVTVDDIQACLNDPSPVVDKALISLSKARNLSLPRATVEMFKKSPDATVAAATGS